MVLDNRKTTSSESNYKIFFDFVNVDDISGGLLTSINGRRDLAIKTYDLYVVNNFELGGEQVIVIKESATGDGGVTYANGRKQESVPINGLLFGATKADVEAKMEELFNIRDRGEVIEFVGPFTKGLRSNKYFIQNVNFTINEGQDRAVGFAMTLQENRAVNVKTVNVNLVNYAPSREYVDFYDSLIGAE
jgi:hypothetical protein